MSDLTRFRDHARAMSTADHKPECNGTPEMVAKRARDIRGWKFLFGEPVLNDPRLTPLEPCDGCVTDADRVWWARLADEADVHLHRHEQDALIP